MPLHITLPDRSPLELPDGATALDAAQAIGPRLAKAAAAAAVAAHGGDSPRPPPVDLTHPLADGDQVAIVTIDSPDGLDVLRHDCSHLLAQAVLRLWPGTKYSIGPTIENGFYYDFQLRSSRSPTPTFRASKRRWRRSSPRTCRSPATSCRSTRRCSSSAGDIGPSAQGLPTGLDQPFKVELVNDLVAAAEAAGEPLPTIRVYTQGEFVDLCRGPHLPSTGRIGKGTFKLTSLAGAYWRGDEHNAQLTRIYGTAFAKKEELAAHLAALEMARQRDHRRIGRDLDLFSFHDEGPGFPSSTPRACASGTPSSTTGARST